LASNHFELQSVSFGRNQISGGSSIEFWPQDIRAQNLHFTGDRKKLIAEGYEQ
jgi:hypothetical protein